MAKISTTEVSSAVGYWSTAVEVVEADVAYSISTGVSYATTTTTSSSWGFSESVALTVGGSESPASATATTTLSKEWKDEIAQMKSWNI